MKQLFLTVALILSLSTLSFANDEDDLNNCLMDAVIEQFESETEDSLELISNVVNSCSTYLASSDFTEDEAVLYALGFTLEILFIGLRECRIELQREAYGNRI